MVVERLPAQDLMMLWGDDFGWPQDMGALAVLDGAALLDADGRFRIEVVRAAIERRLHAVPRFRQLLHSPGPGLGAPLWIDAERFDIAEHVRVMPLGAGAGEAQLLAAVEQLGGRRLDRTRPLWEMWLLPGLPRLQVGLFLRLHHAIADGITAVALLGALLAQDGDAAPPWTPAPRPAAPDLFKDNARHRLEAARRAMSRLVHPVVAARELRRAWPVLRENFVAAAAPRTTLNRPVGPARRLALVRSRLDRAGAIAHAHGATVNDVLLTAVAGGLRDLLHGRGEPVDDLVLQAYVPVSRHRERPGAARGNQVAVMHVPLPVGVEDPVAALRLIARETVRRKDFVRSTDFPFLRTRPAQRAAWHFIRRQRATNLPVTNIPGPPERLCLAGAPLLEVFPILAVFANFTLGVAALSYAGQLNITAVADRDACPDVDVFAAGVRRTLDTLSGRAGTQGEGPGPDGPGAPQRTTAAGVE
jgi:WS/DGAT/MGAT family acyltransferase